MRMDRREGLHIETPPDAHPAEFMRSGCGGRQPGERLFLVFREGFCVWRHGKGHEAELDRDGIYFLGRLEFGRGPGVCGDCQ